MTSGRGNPAADERDASARKYRAQSGPRYASAAVVEARSYSRNSGAISCEETTCASGRRRRNSSAIAPRESDRETRRACRQRRPRRRARKRVEVERHEHAVGPIRSRTPWQSSSERAAGDVRRTTGRDARGSAGADEAGARTRPWRRTPRAPLRSSSAFVAIVVPCEKRSTPSAPTAAAAASTDSSCSRAVGTFAVTKRSPSSSTASVNVPPTSTPRITTARCRPPPQAAGGLRCIVLQLCIIRR